MDLDIGFLGAFQLPFMAHALLTIVVLAVAGGIVGLGISMRELEFISDGLVHAVFPGLVIGAALGGTEGLLPGAVVAALLASLLFTVLGRRATVGNDAAIAVVLTGLFSLGVVLVSRQSGYVSQLQELLFGRLLTVTTAQLWQIVAVALVAALIMALSWRRQVYRAFDPAGFEAAGFSALRTDLALTVATALLVVAGVQALGVLMVIALLTVPMAISRLLTRRFALLVPIAIAVPLVAGVLGLWFAFDLSLRAGVNVSAGALVVLLLVAAYLLVVVATAPLRLGGRGDRGGRGRRSIGRERPAGEASA